MKNKTPAGLIRFRKINILNPAFINSVGHPADSPCWS